MDFNRIQQATRSVQFFLPNSNLKQLLQTSMQTILILFLTETIILLIFVFIIPHSSITRESLIDKRSQLNCTEYLLKHLMMQFYIS